MSTNPLAVRLRRWVALGVMAAGLAGLAPSAYATLTLSPGLIGGSGDVDNVIFNACGLGSTSGTTVQGCLNTSTSTLVNFTSSESLTIGEGGGQAVITPTDGVAFDNVTISLANSALGFGKLQFNLDAIADGTATFSAVDQFGTVFAFGPLALDDTGQNFFTLDSVDGQVAVSFTLVATVGIQNISDLSQVRLGLTERCGFPGGPPCEQNPVPEPASLAIFGAALVALGIVTRSRRRRDETV